MKQEYKIVRHINLLSCIVYDLQLYSATQEKWVSMCVSNFEADIKHYCQNINKMDVYNNRPSWDNCIH